MHGGECCEEAEFDQIAKVCCSSDGAESTQSSSGVGSVGGELPLAFGAGFRLSAETASWGLRADREVSGYAPLRSKHELLSVYLI